MRIALDYWELSQAISNTSHLASELDEYCDGLSRRVQSKVYDVTGGISQALGTAYYYVNQKIDSLCRKETNARSLSQSLDNLLKTAKRVDDDVKSTIESNQKEFFEKRPDLRPSDAQLSLIGFFCDMKDIPGLGWLINAGEKVDKSMANVIEEIRYWYKCEGGKEYVGIILSIAELTGSIVLLVLAVTTPAGLIAGLAAAVGCLIGLFDAVTNSVTSSLSYKSALEGHYGQAEIYSGQDKLSDVLRDTNFHDEEKNRQSNAMSAGLNITEILCDMIDFTVDIKDFAGNLKELNFKKTFNAICSQRDPDGKFTPGKGSIWNGAKTLLSNINARDMILGDLNVRNLSRMDQYGEVTSKLKNYEKFTKAIKGIVNDLDKMNEGDMTLGEFVGKRLLIGLDKSVLKEETLTTKEVNGEIVRIYDSTNLSKVMETLRSPIDGIGITKLIVDSVDRTFLENIISPKGGIIQDVRDMVNVITESFLVREDNVINQQNIINGHIPIKDGLPYLKSYYDPFTKSFFYPFATLQISSRYQHQYVIDTA